MFSYFLVQLETEPVSLLVNVHQKVVFQVEIVQPGKLSLLACIFQLYKPFLSFSIIPKSKFISLSSTFITHLAFLQVQIRSLLLISRHLWGCQSELYLHPKSRFSVNLLNIILTELHHQQVLFR